MTVVAVPTISAERNNWEAISRRDVWANMVALLGTRIEVVVVIDGRSCDQLLTQKFGVDANNVREGCAMIACKCLSSERLWALTSKSFFQFIFFGIFF